MLDCDSNYGLQILVAVRSLGRRPIQTSFESPWQNGVAERWVESCPLVILHDRQQETGELEEIRKHWLERDCGEGQAYWAADGPAESLEPLSKAT